MFLDEPVLAGLIAQLGDHERRLWRRYHVRLRIDRISSDGKSALCSVAQLQTSFLSPSRPAGRLVEMAHNALIPMHLIGIVPLVSVLPEEAKPQFAPVDKEDPFGFLSAIPLRLRHEAAAH